MSRQSPFQSSSSLELVSLKFAFGVQTLNTFLEKIEPVIQDILAIALLQLKPIR